MTYWMMYIVLVIGGESVSTPVSMWYYEEDCKLAALQIMQHPDNRNAVLVDCLKTTEL